MLLLDRFFLLRRFVRGKVEFKASDLTKTKRAVVDSQVMTAKNKSQLKTNQVKVYQAGIAIFRCSYTNTFFSIQSSRGSSHTSPTPPPCPCPYCALGCLLGAKWQWKWWCNFLGADAVQGILGMTLIKKWTPPYWCSQECRPNWRYLWIQRAWMRWNSRRGSCSYTSRRV